MNGETAKKPGLMRDKLTINANREEYGDGRAQIFDLGLVDARGNITNLLLKAKSLPSASASVSMHRFRHRSLLIRSRIRREPI